MPTPGMATGIGGNIGSAWITVGANTSQLVSGMGAATTSMKAFGKAALTLYAVIAAVKATTSAYVEFDRQLKNTSTLLDSTTKEITAMGNEVRAMARQYQVGSAEAQQALYHVISATFYGADALKILEEATKGAAAGLASLGATGDMLTTTLNAYRMSASETAKINDYLFTAVRYGKCLAGDSRVLLSDGRYKRIDALSDGAEVVSFDGKDFVARDAQWVYQGEKTLVKLTTRLGREIKTTWSHPYLTENGWKDVKDLSVGDKIAVPTYIPYFGNIHVDKNKAAFLGLWLAESACGSSCPRLTTSLYKDKLEEIAEYFGCTINNVEKRPDKTPTYDLSNNYNGNRAMEFLRESGIDKCSVSTKFIPEEVFSWDKESIAEFLHWLFNGDGWLCRHIDKGRGYSHQLGYGSKSETLVKQVSHLMLRFGIVGSVRERRYSETIIESLVRDNNNKYWVWECNTNIDIRRFVKSIGIDREFAEEAANRPFVKMRDRADCKISSDDVIEIKLLCASKKYTQKKIAEMFGISQQHVSSIASGQKRGESNIFPKSLEVKDSYRFDRIDKIEELGTEKVYDLVVCDLHNFVAEDIIAHNTTLAELSSNFGRLAGVSAPVGASIQDMVAAIATLTRQGIRTDWAITSLRQTLMQFIKPVKNLKLAIKDLGYSSGPAMIKALGFANALKVVTEYAEENGIEMEQMFTNVRAITAVLPLATTAAAGYAQDLERMANSSGAATAAFEKQTKSWAFQIQKFTTMIGDLAISFGEVLMPAVKGVMLIMEGLATSLRPVITVFKALGGDLLIGVVASLGTISLAILAVTKAVYALQGAISMLQLKAFLGSGGMLAKLASGLMGITGASLGASLLLAGGGVLAGALSVKTLINFDLELGKVSWQASAAKALWQSILSIGGLAAAGFVVGGGVGAAIGAAIGTIGVVINVIHEVYDYRQTPEGQGKVMTEEGWIVSRDIATGQSAGASNRDAIAAGASAAAAFIDEWRGVLDAEAKSGTVSASVKNWIKDAATFTGGPEVVVPAVESFFATIVDEFGLEFAKQARGGFSIDWSNVLALTAPQVDSIGSGFDPILKRITEDFDNLYAALGRADIGDKTAAFAAIGDSLSGWREEVQTMAVVGDITAEKAAYLTGIIDNLGISIGILPDETLSLMEEFKRLNAIINDVGASGSEKADALRDLIKMYAEVTEDTDILAKYLNMTDDELIAVTAELEKLGIVLSNLKSLAEQLAGVNLNDLSGGISDVLNTKLSELSTAFQAEDTDLGGIMGIIGELQSGETSIASAMEELEKTYNSTNALITDEMKAGAREVHSALSGFVDIFGQTDAEIEAARQKAIDDAKRAADKAQSDADAAAREAEQAAKDAAQAAQDAFKEQFKKPILEGIKTGDWQSAVDAISGFAQSGRALMDLASNLSTANDVVIDEAEVLGLIVGASGELMSTIESMITMGNMAGEDVTALERMKWAIEGILDPLKQFKRELLENIIVNPGQFGEAYGGRLRAMIPKMATGGRVDTEGYAYLHEGEDVIPAGVSALSTPTSSACSGGVCPIPDDLFDESAAMMAQASANVVASFEDVTSAAEANAVSSTDVVFGFEKFSEELGYVLDSFSVVEGWASDMESVGLYDQANYLSDALKIARDGFIEAVSGLSAMTVKVINSLKELATSISGIVRSAFKDLFRNLFDLSSSAEETSNSLNVPSGYKVERAAWAAATPGEPGDPMGGGEGFSLADWAAQLGAEILGAITDALVDFAWDNFIEPWTADLWENIIKPFVWEDFIVDFLWEDVIVGFLWEKVIKPFLWEPIIAPAITWITNFVAALSTGTATITGFGLAVAGFMVLLAALGAMIGVVMGVLAFLWGAIQGIGDLLSAFFKPIIEAVGWAWEALTPMIDGARKLFGALAPIMEIFGEVVAFGIRLVTPLFTILGAALGWLGDVINALANAIKWIWDNSLGFVLKLFANLMGGLANIIIALGNAISGVIRFITFGLVNIGTTPYVELPALASGGFVTDTGAALVHQGEVVAPAGTSPLGNYGNEGMMIENVMVVDGEVLYRATKKVNRQEQLRRTGSSIGGRAWQGA